jgi:formylglycine-generating enzyme required for sulfatase activity
MTRMYMDRSEVTVAAFRRCVEAGRCRLSGGGPMPTGGALAACNWDQADREDHPMNCLLWEQARAFCRYAGKRLPTAEEWEYVARSTGTHYAVHLGVSELRDHTYWPWSGPALPTCDQANLRECGLGGTVPVCSQPAGNTEQGVCDVVGNVSEFTSECEAWTEWEPSDYGPGEHIPSRICTVRGQSWDSSPSRPLLMLVTPAGSMEPGRDREHGVGFRCAREMRP